MDTDHSPTVKKRRGIISARASGRQDENLTGQVRELASATTDFMARHRAELESIRSEVDAQAMRFAAMGASAGRPEMTEFHAPEPGYTSSFASWFRKGDDENDVKQANATGRRHVVHASLSGTSDVTGGYLAPTEWDRRLLKTLEAQSPMRRLARVITTSVRAYSTIYRATGWASGWVNETDARPVTTTPTLASLSFPNGEIYANPAITQQLLDDADFDVAAWIASEVSDEFSKQESAAFITGNGVKKPRGLLTYVDGGDSDDHHPGGNLVAVPTGHATGFLSDVQGDFLISFVYGLPSPYRRNAKWVMNSATAAIVLRFKTAGSGEYLWRESMVLGQPATLMGYPVEIDENMPDVGAGAYPIAFGDFNRGYVINDRHGLRMLRDPYTNKPYVDFYCTKRVGGGVEDPKAIRLVKIAVS